MISIGEAREQLWEIFDSLGLVEENEDGEILIHNEQIDSIQLISIIVDIEEKFMVEIPDEYMVPEFIESFDHVLEVVYELLEQEPVCLGESVQGQAAAISSDEN